MEIFKIVFTGGPCAGKTEVIDKVKEKLENDNYYVVVVPETAAELISKGIIPNEDRKHTLKFQDLVFETQSRKEQVAEEYCEFIRDCNLDFIKDKKGIIILYDRGIMDNRAYLSHEDYNNLLKKFNCNELEVIDKYDLVINLVSLATTNPELYALDGIRYEPPEIAAYEDGLTTSAWSLHRDLKVVKPTEKIEEKILTVLNIIYNKLNNQYNNDLISFEVDKEKTDYSYFNNDNSRKINVNTYYLQIIDNIRVTIEERKYNENLSFIMKKEVINANGLLTIESKPITKEQFNILRSNNLLTPIDEKNIINFIDHGNYFTIIEDNSCTKLYTEENNVLLIPHNIVLKKGKTFIK